MTDSPHAGTIVRVDPKLLITDAGNVRRDLRLDPKFIDSFREHGVLQPIVVRPADLYLGSYEVVMGHRRTAAALAAGLTEVPVYVQTRHDGDEETIRITTQVVENQHRAALDTLDEATAVQQLSLFGMPATMIAKSLATPISRVGDAIKIARSTAIPRDRALTFEQAAAIAEFETSPAAVKRIIDTVTNNPNSLPHVIDDLRKKAELADHIAELAAAIDAAGYVRLPDQQYAVSWTAAHRGRETRPLGDVALAATPHEKLTLDTVPDTVQVAAQIQNEWETADGKYRAWAATHYGVIARTAGVPLADAGLVTWTSARTGEDTVRDVALKAEIAERHAEAARRDENLEALWAENRAAAAIRVAWLITFLQRTRLPDLTALAAYALVHLELNTEAPEVFNLLGLEYDEEGNPWLELESEVLNPRRSAAVLGAIIFAAFEEHLDSRWGNYPHAPAYLASLREWGYGLSDWELALVEPPAAEPEDES
ncbi:ParB/RepB/Spo0J family partition protein [Rathayibacter sp. PhB151]|uniref:ParB/RepB/Spo0J family partition protein n=1 Tax=Rathayibacter sp. PhB151 TaxID=2485189 RepID=UPI001062944F|nr:ParB/RepB/Spo0J family partition protein [Rathayibacter sp. PhB151]TDX78694.1 ParB/RepB/Spo0J family partition protein [Rathayibacter sp. PhB151]